MNRSVIIKMSEEYSKHGFRGSWRKNKSITIDSFSNFDGNKAKLSDTYPSKQSSITVAEELRWVKVNLEYIGNLYVKFAFQSEFSSEQVDSYLREEASILQNIESRPDCECNDELQDDSEKEEDALLKLQNTAVMFSLKSDFSTESTYRTMLGFSSTSSACSAIPIKITANKKTHFLSGTETGKKRKSKRQSQSPESANKKPKQRINETENKDSKRKRQFGSGTNNKRKKKVTDIIVSHQNSDRRLHEEATQKVAKMDDDEVSKKCANWTSFKIIQNSTLRETLIAFSCSKEKNKLKKLLLKRVQPICDSDLSDLVTDSRISEPVKKYLLLITINAESVGRYVVTPTDHTGEDWSLLAAMKIKSVTKTIMTVRVAKYLQATRDKDNNIIGCCFLKSVTNPGVLISGQEFQLPLTIEPASRYAVIASLGAPSNSSRGAPSSSGQPPLLPRPTRRVESLAEKNLNKLLLAEKLKKKSEEEQHIVLAQYLQQDTVFVASTASSINTINQKNELSITAQNKKNDTVCFPFVQHHIQYAHNTTAVNSERTMTLCLGSKSFQKLKDAIEVENVKAKFFLNVEKMTLTRIPPYGFCGLLCLLLFWRKKHENTNTLLDLTNFEVRSEVTELVNILINHAEEKNQEYRTRFQFESLQNFRSILLDSKDVVRAPNCLWPDHQTMFKWAKILKLNINFFEKNYDRCLEDGWFQLASVSDNIDHEFQIKDIQMICENTNNIVLQDGHFTPVVMSSNTPALLDSLITKFLENVVALLPQGDDDSADVLLGTQTECDAVNFHQYDITPATPPAATQSDCIGDSP
jgi:hypothetical protein